MTSTSSKTGKFQILIVDDELDMLEFMERVLRREFQVTITDDAEKALQHLAGGSYDMLITDHQMPKISGLQLLRRTEALAPDLVRIVISGFSEEPDIQQAVDSGIAHNYILKPIDARELLGAVEQAFARYVAGVRSS